MPEMGGKGEMIQRVRHLLSGFVLAAALAGSVTAAEATLEDGLIDVTVGDVTILEDARVPVAARVAANLCGVRVDSVLARSVAVDRSGTATTVCTANARAVRLEQN